MVIRYALPLLAGLTLSGCATKGHIKNDAMTSRPYAATRSNAEIAWDVGAMRYKKYTDECPAFIGWFSLAALPLNIVADTVLLPFSTTDPNPSGSAPRSEQPQLPQPARSTHHQ